MKMYVKLTKIPQEENIFHDGLTQILFLNIIIVVPQKDDILANAPTLDSGDSVPNYILPIVYTGLQQCWAEF